MSEDGWEIQQKTGVPLSYAYLENRVGTAVYLWQLPADEILISCSCLTSCPVPSETAHPTELLGKMGDFLSYEAWKLEIFSIKC